MVLDMLILLGFGLIGGLVLEGLSMDFSVSKSRKGASGCSFDGE
jgi:hypothetical protein